ncbi:hypothetical protein E2562_007345 [Oryza meyeriana var. granulata]|uniref:PGG domain-containing protein n=1 Tax=Oryza meyeriana var. granulata TaxID=110450 RepID=A0A6G1CYM9_9ORYZ|nr:hypothetical protein E2562_007345 [Oryza meyeriana var. granulata]
MEHKCLTDRYYTDEVVNNLEKQMTWEVWRVNALLVVNAMLMGVVVGIGVYAPRYRRHPFARFLFQGATALFMPIVSYVVLLLIILTLSSL